MILEALWARGEHIKEIMDKIPQVQFFAHIHSNIPFYSLEGSAYRFLESFNKVGIGIIFNSIHAKDALYFLDNTYYLPNIYKLDFQDPLKREDDGYLNVACMGSIRPMKNQAIQALASMRYAESIGKRLRIHFNFGREEMGGGCGKEKYNLSFQDEPQT